MEYIGEAIQLVLIGAGLGVQWAFLKSEIRTNREAIKAMREGDDIYIKLQVGKAEDRINGKIAPIVKQVETNTERINELWGEET